MTRPTDPPGSDFGRKNLSDTPERRAYEAPAIHGEEPIRQDVLASHSVHITAEAFCGCS
jgi:hypothetical protein